MVGPNGNTLPPAYGQLTSFDIYEDNFYGTFLVVPGYYDSGNP